MRPSMPPKAKTGMKLMTMIIKAKKMGRPTVCKAGVSSARALASLSV